MEEIQLRLTLGEVNLILEALGERSYKQVYQLISKIQAQAGTQLQESVPSVANGPDEKSGERG